MSNRNYVAGRRWEYRVMAMMRDEHNHTVMRTAGSHGPFDIIAIPNVGPHIVRMIQCKVVADQATADRMLKEFVKHPPFDPRMCEFDQSMEIWVKSTKKHCWDLA